MTHFVRQAQLLLLHTRLHVSTLIIGHLQAFLQLSLQMLWMLGSHHVYINKNIKIYASQFMSWSGLCYQMALKSKKFKKFVLIWATLVLLFNSEISPQPNVLLPWVILAQMFLAISGPAVTFTVSRATSLFICLITFNGYQTQIICSWGPTCQSLSKWRTTCSHQKGAVLMPANVPIILLPLWKKWKVCLCCHGSAEVTHVSL
jgi:hypothetical protein